MTEQHQNDRQEYHREYWKKYKHRLHRVVVSLTPTEYKRIEKAAEFEGITLSKIVKRFALAYCDDTYVVPRDTVEKLNAIAFILRQYGNNVNQIARHFNADAKAGRFRECPEIFPTLVRIHAALQTMENEVKRIVESGEL